jgi:diguanylate cyclase (GGDEF)-like protein
MQINMNNNKKSHPAVEFDCDQTQRTHAVRISFVDVVIKGMAGIAVVGIISVFSRSLSTGWHLASTLQLLVSLSITLLFLFHKKLSYSLKVGVIFVAFGVVGVSGLPTFGLAATSTIWLLLACIVSNVLFSRLIGMMSITATFLILTITAFLFVSGKLISPIDFQVHLRSTASWAGMILVNCGGAFIIILAMGTYNRSVLMLMNKVNEQNALIKAQASQIEHLANHDALTGLPSRRLAYDRLVMACSQAERTHSKAAVLFIDLDGFKAVNDSFMHEAGDYVLKTIASRLTESIRKIDTAARQGGDEFLIILNGIDNSEDADIVARKIRAAIAEPIIYAEQILKVGASIGVAVYPDHSDTADELLKTADLAMYTVKKSGDESA